MKNEKDLGADAAAVEGAGSIDSDSRQVAEKIAHMRTLLNWSVDAPLDFRCVACGVRRVQHAVWPRYSGSAFCVDCGFSQCSGETVLRPEHKCCSHDHRGGLGLQPDCRDHKGAPLIATGNPASIVVEGLEREATADDLRDDYMEKVRR